MGPVRRSLNQRFINLKFLRTRNSVGILSTLNPAELKFGHLICFYDTQLVYIQSINLSQFYLGMVIALPILRSRRVPRIRTPPKNHKQSKSMKLNKTSRIGAALLAVMALSSAAAHAVAITGVVSFSGGATLDSPDLNSATMVLNWQDEKVGSLHTGSFSVLSTGQAATFTDGWVFGSGIAPLWTVGGFTFDLTSSTVVFQNSVILGISGKGVVSGNGYDATPGRWAFTTQVPQVDATFEFSAAEAEEIPDGGSSVALLGASLLGIGAVRRKLKK